MNINSDISPVLDHMPRHLATNGGDLPFQISNAGFFGIVIDDRPDRTFRDIEFYIINSAFLFLTRHQIALGDIELLELRVARQLNNLHSILEGKRNTGEHIGRRNKHHIGKIVIQIQIVIIEHVVLFGIQHL